MKVFKVSILTIAWIISMTLLAHAGPKVIFSFEDTSCAAWKKSQGRESERARYIYWFRGFVSGYNYASQDQAGTMPDSESLSLFIDKYCEKNPSKPFIGAVFPLINDLVPHKSHKSSTPTR
jgi:hypothetical protein